MANTFLQATSNPVANVEQLNNPNNNTVQPVANQTQNNTGANSISPITIPIQIQPQVASAVGEATAQTNNQNISVAPTPQTYNANNTNTNVVDFNKIYNSYRSKYGNNNSNQSINSGVKKTSIGTTIVTPTTSNPNTIEGQYQSAYSDTINGILSELLTQMQGGFEYNPNEDSSLKVATEYAANSTLQSLAGSGVLNSTATAERVARIVSELIPQYEEISHDRWLEKFQLFADTAQIVMSYDEQQFSYWKDAQDRKFEKEQFEYEKEQKELENAWQRVDELGYVDNESSILLGVPVGTLSKDAREAKEEREFELAKMREQAQIEYDNSVALAKIKEELSYETQSKLNEQEYQLSSSDNYETYDEIIKNRYAEYDDYTKQYVVSDEENYNQLGDYLDYLYVNGMITETEFLQLSAKYSKYANQIGSTTTSELEPGLDDTNVGTWIKALDGNNKALETLGVDIWGQKKSNVNNTDAKNAVNTALNEIQNGTYTFTSNQQLMNDLKSGRFGSLGWGL